MRAPGSSNAVKSMLTQTVVRFENVAQLFEKAPMKLGCRGDLTIWWEMKSAFEKVTVPEGADKLKTLIEDQFVIATGQVLRDFPDDINATGACFSLERKDETELVNGSWWKNKLLPLLLDRYKTKSPNLNIYD